MSPRDFNIFDVDEVFFFTLRTILLLNCGDNFSGLPVGFRVLTLFRAVISPFSNSDNLTIYVF